MSSQGTQSTLFAMRDGTIAQLVEQRTFNPFVVGSTPAGPTKFESTLYESTKCFSTFSGPFFAASPTAPKIFSV